MIFARLFGGLGSQMFQYAAGQALTTRPISLCKHNIIANSSFSWWGAWLNENPNKAVAAPDPWFAAKGMQNPDILPHNWHRISLPD